MTRIPRFQGQSLYTLKRRLGARLRRFVLRCFVPSPAMHRMRFGGRSYKRIASIDAWRPASLAKILEGYRSQRIFPEVITRFENEQTPQRLRYCRA